MTKPYLSFEQQPAFRELLLLVSQGQSFNLVFGAGVSMGAGLPSWPRLVESLADEIKDLDIRAAVHADGVDIIRKADIINMLLSGSRKSAIRSSLYPDNTQPPPGSLAVAIARLAISSPDLVHLITTNYDNLVEQSIKAESQGTCSSTSFTFDHADDWKTAARDANNIPILHIHGFLDIADSANEEPLILTESEFRQYGADIRRFIAEAIAERPTVFVGVSLTDPNVVGPLDSLKGDPSVPPTFVLSGPDSVRGVDPSVMLEYAKVKADQLEKSFGTKVVRTKSYGQVSQVMREMLAVQDPSIGGKQFFAKRSRTRYGFRFEANLKAAYTHLGSKKTCQVTPEMLEEVRQRLAQAVRVKFRREARDAVEPLAAKFKRQHGVDLVDAAATEPFSMTLWLRVPPGTNGDSADYAIQPVGSSAYAHTETWAYVTPQLVAPFSRYPAVTAVHTESTQLRTLEVPHPWPSILALPLMLPEPHGGELCLGAVTIQSAYSLSSPSDKPISLFAAAEQDRRVMDQITAVLNEIGLSTVGLG